MSLGKFTLWTLEPIVSLILRQDLVSFLTVSVFSLLSKLVMWINLSCKEVNLEMKEKLKLKNKKEDKLFNLL